MFFNHTAIQRLNEASYHRHLFFLPLSFFYPPFPSELCPFLFLSTRLAHTPLSPTVTHRSLPCFSTVPLLSSPTVSLYFSRAPNPTIPSLSFSPSFFLFSFLLSFFPPFFLYLILSQSLSRFVSLLRAIFVPAVACSPTVGKQLIMGSKGWRGVGVVAL